MCTVTLMILSCYVPIKAEGSSQITTLETVCLSVNQHIKDIIKTAAFFHLHNTDSVISV